MLAVLEVKEPIYGDRPNKSGKNVSIIGAVESQKYDGSAGGSLMGATDVLTFEYCEGQYNWMKWKDCDSENCAIGSNLTWEW